MWQEVQGKFCDSCPHKSDDPQYLYCFRAKRNEEIQICFVETADRDYIISRDLLRLGLKEEALFHISQALEKYLKSVLLYDNVSIKDHSHDIGKLRDQVKNTLNINIDLIFSHRNHEFSFYDIVEQHVDRYGVISFPSFFSAFWTTPELNFVALLDEAIFNLRRYCRDIDFEAKLGEDSREYWINQICPANPKIWAYLEYVLSSDTIPEILRQREILCRENKYASAFTSSFSSAHLDQRRRLYSDGSLCNKSLEDWRESHYYVTKTQKEYLKKL